MPNGARWTTLKGLETKRTDEQRAALLDLEKRGLATATAFRIKKMLHWVREADGRQAARWRSMRFIKAARKLVRDNSLSAPMPSALQTFEKHLPLVLRHWESLLSNARLEGFNGLFQAAWPRARWYRNSINFITMIYLIGAPIAKLLTEAVPH